MKLRYTLPLTSLTCLCLVACQSKDKAENTNQNSDTEPHADQASATNDVADSGHGMAVSQFKGALAEVNAQCPENYPDVVTPLPENKDFESIETAELIKMLESWNPSLRAQAAQALGERGTEVKSTLMDATQSDNWMVRAGSASALAAIAKNAIQQVKRPEQHAVRESFSDVTAVCVDLCADDRLEVRVAALAAISSIQPRSPDAVRALLKLCGDPDEYLSQNAMVVIRKSVGIKGVEEDVILEGFRSAFKSPLPNGKGNIVLVIETMEPEFQRKLVPELVAHVAWKPRRDTMFAGTGQEGAIKMLTKMKETSVIEHLPMAMGKIHRGPGLFDICLDSAKAFGKDAKVILPELKSIQADIKANGKDAKIRPNTDEEKSLKKLKETIEYLESL